MSINNNTSEHRLKIGDKVVTATAQREGLHSPLSSNNKDIRFGKVVEVNTKTYGVAHLRGGYSPRVRANNIIPVGSYRIAPRGDYRYISIGSNLVKAEVVKRTSKGVHLKYHDLTFFKLNHKVMKATSWLPTLLNWLYKWKCRDSLGVALIETLVVLMYYFYA